MAPAARDSDSDMGRTRSSPRKSGEQSPEILEESDQPGPEDSGGEEETYEIEAILDAKRGATGSTRIGYLVKWKNYGEDENSWVDEEDAAGAKELIAEFWARRGGRKGEKGGRKSETKPKATPRRSIAASPDSTPEPSSTATKKRGRGRPKTKVETESEIEEEEEPRTRKKGRKSNGSRRKPSPSPEPSEEEPESEFVEPSTIKKWGNLPSWERHIQVIDTIERSTDGELYVYFKLKGEKVPCKEQSKVCAEKFPQELIKFYESNLKWKTVDETSDDAE
ncbi:hypothetical protein BC834DRAFT_858143 [Gloeopeniophorella convolvens]|nr:hypothetical protein BC834DRAFT_858143 [Gloeopeniophorella convolvens]